MMLKKVIFLTALSIIGLLALFVYDRKRISDGLLHVVFCDVGQGDGIFIRTPNGEDVLIDGGPNNDVLLCLSENMPFWDKKIDLMILTHPDSDHYAGLISVSKQYEVGSFATSFTQKDASGYKTLSEILKEKGVKQRFVCQNDSFKFPGGVIMKVLWPKSCSLGSTEKNDNSVVALLEYKDLQILLTGDAEVNIGEFYQGLTGDIDILKVPHHGSKDGVDEDYLKDLKPEIAILSVGEKNRYRHPSKEIINILSSEGIKIFRTDTQGDIKIKSDGKSYRIETTDE